MRVAEQPACVDAPCRIERARTIADLDAATRLRCEVYLEATGVDRTALPGSRDISGLDVLETTTVFLARVGGETVGTLRLAYPNPELAEQYAAPLGLPSAVTYDLQDLPAEPVFAELNRLAVRSDHRGRSVAGSLYQAAYVASRAAGFTHWLGMTLTATDVEEDAQIIAAGMRRAGRHQAQPRLVARVQKQPAVSRRPLFSDDERRRARQGEAIRLPHVVDFHIRCNVNTIGAPIYDPVFAEYMIPVVLGLDAYAASDFGRRYT